MRWYLQTCGETHEQGYSWVEVLPDETRRTAESAIFPGSTKAHPLVHAEEFSLSLARNRNSLILHVTGMNSNRKNPYRVVRNSLICIGQEAEQRILRCIAVTALIGELNTLIDNEIEACLDDPKGFDVKSPESFIALLSELDIDALVKLRLDFVSDKKQTTHGRVCRNNDNGRKRLAEDIAQFNLPKRQGPLIVVTSLAQKKEDLQEIGVWRGLYDDLSAGISEWEEFALLEDRNGGIFRKITNNKGSNVLNTSISKKKTSEQSTDVSQNRERAVSLVKEGLEHQSDKAYEQALEKFNLAINLDQGNAKYILDRGQLYYIMRRYKEAIGDFTHIIDTCYDENRYYAFKYRGNTYLQLDQYQDAIADFNQAMQLDKIKQESFADRGRVFLRMGRQQDALADFSQATLTSPENYLAFTCIGQIYGYIGKYEKAIENFEKAISLNSKAYNAFAQRGLVYYFMKLYDEALADYERAIQLDNETPWVFALRGATYRVREQYEEALENFERAISLDKQNESAFVGRGKTYRDQGQYEKAIDSFSQALLLNSKKSKYRYYKAEIYLREQRLRAFESEWHAAIRMAKSTFIAESKKKTDHWYTDFDLALCYLISSETLVEARSLYEKLIESCEFVQPLKDVAMDIKDLLVMQPQNEVALYIYEQLEKRINTLID